MDRQVSSRTIEILRKKAQQSICKYPMSAIGLNNNNDIVAKATNTPRFPGRGGGEHAEEKVMQAARKKGVTTIIICRIGKAGDFLPIEPCKRCQKHADKLGIKLITVPED